MSPVEQAFNTLKKGVLGVVENYTGGWHSTNEFTLRRSIVIGFDVRDSDDRLIGRLDGHVHLYDEHTQEEFVRALRREG